MAIQTERDLNCLVTFDDRYLVRKYDVVGENVTKFVLNSSTPTDDTTGDPSQWVATVTEAGTGNSTVLNSVTAGELLTITTAANEYDGVSYQAKGESFKLDSTRKMYFGCKIKASDVTQSDILIGLAETDTTLIATSSAHAIAVTGDGVFFSSLDASTTLAAKTYASGSEVSTANYATALADDTAVMVEIFWDRETVKFYVDNNLVTSTSAVSAITGDMTLSIAYAAGEAVAKTATIYQLKCFQWD